jgi:hypothetical protein
MPTTLNKLASRYPAIQWDQFALVAQSRRFFDWFNAFVKTRLYGGSVLGGAFFLGVYFLPMIIAIKRQASPDLDDWDAQCIPSFDSNCWDDRRRQRSSGVFGRGDGRRLAGLLTWACIQKTPKSCSTRMTHSNGARPCVGLPGGQVGAQNT